MYYCVQKKWTPDLRHNRINPVHTFTRHCFKFRYNFILISTYKSTRYTLLNLTNKTLYSFVFNLCMLYVLPIPFSQTLPC
jgi:hypothetical protein